MSNSCNHEMCWIDSVLTSTKEKQQLKNNLFVPKMPESWKKIQVNGYPVLKYQMF